jgi:quinol monooxygenase YgiN
MVILSIKMMVRPEKRKELSQTLRSIVAHVRKESGCLHSGFYQNIEDENQFLFIEEWLSQDDFAAHSQSDLFTVIKGTESLLQRPLEIVTHTVDGLTELEV